jgi:hypothetical protein
MAVNSVLWNGISRWFAGSRLVRRLAEALARAGASRRVAELDSQLAERCQLIGLQGLVHRARTTRFGREHDFARIHDIKDYQRLVPLSTPQSLWARYWMPALPDLAAATWLEPATQLATMNAINLEGIYHLPVSPALCRSYWKALKTGLALLFTARPGLRPFSGRVLFLGPPARLAAIPGDRTNRLDDSLASAAPLLFAPHIRSAGQGLLPSAESAVRQEPILHEILRQRHSCIIADYDRLQQLLRLAHAVTGKRSIREIWPDLSAVIITSRVAPETKLHGGGEFPIAFDGVAACQACLPLEAPLAIEDHRHGLLRVLPDLGAFYEFIPVQELQKEGPTRHVLAQVESGQEYAVAFTSPAGLWSCLSDLRVTFANRNPWLLRQVRQETPEFRTTLPETVPFTAFPPPLPGAHPRSNGNVVRRPGISFRSASSVRVGRE